MRDITPFLTVCGILCVWPALCSFIAFYLGRRGLPFRVVRTNNDSAHGRQLRGKLAIRSEQ